MQPINMPLNLNIKRAMLATMFMASLSVVSAAEETRYSFETSVQKTLSQNPDVNISDFKMQQAQAMLNKSNASRLPILTASITAVNSDNALNVFGMRLQERVVTQTDFIPANLNNPDSYTDMNTRLELQVPIWNGGKISGYQSQANAMILAAKRGDVAVKQQLTFQVFKAYESAFTAQKYIKVAEQAVSAAESFYQTTENLVKQGVLVRSDALNAKVSLSEARTAWVEAQGKKDMALDGLRLLMGLPARQQFDIEGQTNIRLPANNLDDLLVMAQAHNPQLAAKRQEAKSYSAAIDVAKADQYPSINLMARQEWHDESLGFESSSYTIAAVAKWTLYDFGATSYGVDQAKAAANEQKAQTRSEMNRVSQKVLTSWRGLDLGKKKMKSQVITVEQAKDAQQLVMRRYENGLTTLTDVLGSFAQLDKARADVVKTQFDINMCIANLRLETGTMSLEQLSTQ